MNDTIRRLLSLTASIVLLFGAATAYAATPTISVASIEPSTTVTVGTPITFALSISGFINPTYQLSDAFIDGSLGNLNLNSAGEFSWTPEINDVGSHTVTITATDNSGDTASTTIVLDVVTSGTTTVTTPITVAAPAATIVTTSPVDPFTENLTLDATGTEVTELQQVLTGQGDFTGPVTGYYGSLTKAAVIKFQAAHNIEQLGIVGPATLAALNAIENTTTAAAPAVVTTTSSASSPTLSEIQTEIQSISSSLSQVESQLSQLVGQ